MDAEEKFVSVSLGRERHKIRYTAGMNFSAIREELSRLTSQDASSFRLLCKGRTVNDTDAVPTPETAPVQILALLTKSAHRTAVSSRPRGSSSTPSLAEAREAAASSSKPKQTVEPVGKVTGGEEISEGEPYVVALVNGKRYRVRTPEGCTAGDVKARVAGFEGVDAYASEMILRGAGRVLRDEDVFDAGGQRTLWIQLSPEYHERCAGAKDVSRIEIDAENIEKRAVGLRRQLEKRLAYVEEARIVMAELKRDLHVLKDQLEKAKGDHRKAEARKMIQKAEDIVEEIAQILGF